MPEDFKKGQKGKHESKEQRKSKQRHQTSEKKPEKKSEPIKGTTSETKPEKKLEIKVTKSALEEPGPEFYKSLKRETDDILKITEEANSKYKKKEIQSNWAKYEMPIESYEEIDKEHILGADFEKLIQAPSSVGNHFQFKHEKSWDENSGPLPYDKYFYINMDNLAIALSTIPFHERNNVDITMFTDTDILSMNTRSVRYKKKYYNDDSYTTPELIAQDKILSFIESKDKINTNEDVGDKDNNDLIQDIKKASSDKATKAEVSTLEVERGMEYVQSIEVKYQTPNDTKINNGLDDYLADVHLEDKPAGKLYGPNTRLSSEPESKNPANETNPGIDSPEDLEKWLDDFLDD